MMINVRKRLRAALQIQQHYESLTVSTVPDPPQELWLLLKQTGRHLKHCRQQGWNGTASRLEDRYLQQLERLGARCRELVAVFQQQKSGVFVPSLRDLYEELQALEQEFPEVRIALAEKTVSVITLPITLEEIELGPFEIRLDWASLRDSTSYQVLALEPNPAGDSSATTHPHVYENTLCEGDAKLAIRTALQQGRLSDVFLLISRVLHTYNPGSAYTKLSEWDGVCCPDCGDHCGIEDFGRCDQCDIERCDPCLTGCGDCGNSLCSRCEHLCDGCQEPHCPGCLESCSDCARSVCPACQSDGYCQDCYNLLLEEENHDQTDFSDETLITPTTPPHPTETVSQTDIDVQPHRLVEAAVSP